jgi:hypothetical protein
MSKLLPVVTTSEGEPVTVTRPHREGDKVCGICGSTTLALGVEVGGVYQETCVIHLATDPAWRLKMRLTKSQMADFLAPLAMDVRLGFETAEQVRPHFMKLTWDELWYLTKKRADPEQRAEYDEEIRQMLEEAL